MNSKKTWFIGYTSRLWIPVSIEGFVVTALFFVGIIVIGALNNAATKSNLAINQIISILLEFVALLIACYFITRGHIDKRY